MINFLIKFFRKESEPLPPKYRVTPCSNGKYMLEVYSPIVGLYLAEKVVRDLQEADEVIKHIEGKTFYFYEK